jgi:hypothetical protein
MQELLMKLEKTEKADKFEPSDLKHLTDGEKQKILL